MFNQQLQTALANALDLNLARLKCLSLLIAATMKHRSVNLVQLATTEDGRACSNESRYRRFQDFFLRTRLCFCSVSKLILQRIPKAQERLPPRSRPNQLGVRSPNDQLPRFRDRDRQSFDPNHVEGPAKEKQRGKLQSKTADHLDEKAPQNHSRKRYPRPHDGP